MLEVKDLVKRYGDHTAVDHLSFSVGERQVFGFLGPNGAGKSTTMNIITGTLSATEGSVRVNGFDIFRQSKQARRCIGYLPEIPPLYGELSPREYLRFVAQAKGIGPGAERSAIDAAIERTRIGPMSDRLIRSLSKGYQQRVGLAQAILGDPELLILDEPTVGMDPQQIIDVRDLILELGQRCSVILSSHILSEISSLCSQVMIISQGRLVSIGSPAQLEEQADRGQRCKLTVSAGDAALAAAAVKSVPGADIEARRYSEDGLTLAVTVSGGDGMGLQALLSQALLRYKCPVLSLEQDKASLEDVFLKLVAADKENDEKGSGAR